MDTMTFDHEREPQLRQSQLAKMPLPQLQAELQSRELRLESIADQMQSAQEMPSVSRGHAWKAKALTARSHARREMGWLITEIARRQVAVGPADTKELDRMEDLIWDRAGLSGDDRAWDQLTGDEQWVTLTIAVEMILDKAPTPGWERAAALFRRLTDREEDPSA